MPHGVGIAVPVHVSFPDQLSGASHNGTSGLLLPVLTAQEVAVSGSVIAFGSLSAGRSEGAA